MGGKGTAVAKAADSFQQHQVNIVIQTYQEIYGDAPHAVVKKSLDAQPTSTADLDIRIPPGFWFTRGR